MIIISDSSPLSALAQMGELDLLRILYGRVVIPETVLRECNHSRSPAGLVELLGRSDCFIEVVPDPPLLAETRDVDPGEAAAISLAWACRDEATLIIDDRDGRKVSESLGLRITGTAGVLLAAANSGLIDFEDAVIRLQATGFRIHPDVVLTLVSKLRKPQT